MRALRGRLSHCRFLHTSAVRHFEPLTVLAVGSLKALSAKLAAGSAAKIAATSTAAKAVAAKASVAKLGTAHSTVLPTVAGKCGAQSALAKPSAAAALGGAVEVSSSVVDSIPELPLDSASASFVDAASTVQEAGTGIPHGLAETSVTTVGGVTAASGMTDAASLTSPSASGVTDGAFVEASMPSDAPVEAFTAGSTDGLDQATGEISEVPASQHLDAADGPEIHGAQAQGDAVGEGAFLAIAAAGSGILKSGAVAVSFAMKSAGAACVAAWKTATSVLDTMRLALGALLGVLTLAMSVASSTFSLTWDAICKLRHQAPEDAMPDSRGS